MYIYIKRIYIYIYMCVCCMYISIHICRFVIYVMYVCVYIYIYICRRASAAPAGSPGSCTARGGRRPRPPRPRPSTPDMLVRLKTVYTSRFVSVILPVIVLFYNNNCGAMLIFSVSLQS